MRHTNSLACVLLSGIFTAAGWSAAPVQEASSAASPGESARPALLAYGTGSIRLEFTMDLCEIAPGTYATQARITNNTGEALVWTVPTISVEGNTAQCNLGEMRPGETKRAGFTFGSVRGLVAGRTYQAELNTQVVTASGEQRFYTTTSRIRVQ